VSYTRSFEEAPGAAPSRVCPRPLALAARASGRGVLAPIGTCHVPGTAREADAQSRTRGYARYAVPLGTPSRPCDRASKRWLAITAALAAAAWVEPPAAASVDPADPADPALEA